MNDLIETAANLPLHILLDTLNASAIISGTPNETTQGGTCLEGTESYWVLRMLDGSYAVGIASRGCYPWWTSHATRVAAMDFVHENVRALGLQS